MVSGRVDGKVWSPDCQSRVETGTGVPGQMGLSGLFQVE